MDYKTGQKLVKNKEFAKALKIFLDLLDKGNKDIVIFFYLGRIYFELNEYKKSIFYYEKCLSIDPNSVNTLFNLAIVKQSIGELITAKEIYLKLININKFDIPSYFGLFMINPKFILKGYIENFLKVLNKNEINMHDKSLIYFILSKIEKEKKNFNKELVYLDKFHSLSFKSNYQYNKQSEFYYKSIINNFYNKIEFVNNKNKDSLKKINDIKPIFIIGLPRSGSTLIESILSSGLKKIKSFGECHVFNMSMLEQIAPKIYNQNFILEKFKFQIDQKWIKHSVLNRYEISFVNGSKDTKIFIDKSLENFFNIEIILNIFPNAKFIHSKRNLIDSILAIYQTMLSELSWTHRIEDILDYVDNYIKIMNFFKKKYPKIIFDVNLEELTSKSEKIGKNIFNFCGLDWDKKSLEFYKSKELFSKTNSFNQIRNKISTYDHNKYKPYISLIEKYKKNYKWIDLP